MRTWQRYALTLLVLASLACTGCRRADERAVYRVARDTLEADRSLGDAVRSGRRREAVIGVLKNAARVDLPYYQGNDATPAGHYTVCFKRIRLRWEVARASRRPEYPPVAR